ncbi:hypothetical protein [Clostridium tagluense]|uniref:WxL domain-containing protein n=1 Tax=Clostridium tagluense TaxID=360422 RepID=A0A401UQI1_9CLOT|nr:hypothetical protein [Clostridium tagluense]GCD11787.1 hypothetical protein Ctaglu_34100 [Clostridium tagluense]
MALGNPVVTWYNNTNTTNVTNWNLGVVDADNDPTLTETQFVIWNNRGGNVAVKSMEQCTITTKDSAGGLNLPLVKETWVQARCDSMGETMFDSTTLIGATFDATGGNWKPKEHVIRAEDSAVGTGVIAGNINTGTLTTIADKQNFSKVTLRMKIPPSATAGNVDFLVRVYYTIL